MLTLGVRAALAFIVTRCDISSFFGMLVLHIYRYHAHMSEAFHNRLKYSTQALLFYSGAGQISVLEHIMASKTLDFFTKYKF